MVGGGVGDGVETTGAISDGDAVDTVSALAPGRGFEGRDGEDAPLWLLPDLGPGLPPSGFSIPILRVTDKTGQ